MSDKSKIPWTEATWNPIRYLDGWMCSKVSAGCLRCYAETFNGRFGNKLPYKGPDPKIGFRLDERVLNQPLHWKIPRRVFVCSMGDLFHSDVPFGFIEKVTAVIEECPQHTFQILTKRPQTMAEYFNGLGKMFELSNCPNLWVGTTCENQAAADERIPHLLKVPAAVRFVSVEPMLGPVNFKQPTGVLKYATRESCPVTRSPLTTVPGIDWGIVGCETGPGRRPCRLEWVRDLVKQCDCAGVPVFIKALTIDGKVSKDPGEWPEDLRRREYPKVKVES